MKKTLIALSAVLCATATLATELTPVGTWRSIDDKTKQPKSEVVIYSKEGALFGKVTKLLRKEANQGVTCTQCSDDRKDKPVIGMEIIRGAKKAEGKDVWEGGRILDPEKGKDYSLRLTPVDGGQKLEVRGSIGPFWRTQVWQRVK